MSARGCWVFRDGQLIDKHLAPPLHVKHANSAYVIGDSLDYVQNMADGKRYTSKSAYYKAVRRAGCEIVGNEKQKAAPKTLGDPTAEVAAAVQHIKLKGKR